MLYNSENWSIQSYFVQQSIYKVGQWQIFFFLISNDKIFIYNCYIKNDLYTKKVKRRGISVSNANADICVAYNKEQGNKGGEVGICMVNYKGYRKFIGEKS